MVALPAGPIAGVTTEVLDETDEAVAGERAVLRAQLRAALRLASAPGLLDGVLA